MSGWGDALAEIASEFADEEPLAYVQDNVALPPCPAIRSDRPAPTFGSPGQSERSIAYEIRFEHLPRRPRSGETFTHRGRRWKVGNVADLDEVGAWEVIVTDAGRA